MPNIAPGAPERKTEEAVAEGPQLIYAYDRVVKMEQVSRSTRLNVIKMQSKTNGWTTDPVQGGHILSPGGEIPYKVLISNLPLKVLSPNRTHGRPKVPAKDI